MINADNTTAEKGPTIRYHSIALVAVKNRTMHGCKFFNAQDICHWRPNLEGQS